MDLHHPLSSPVRYLSLRWKTLILLSVVLVLVNTALALLAYRQSARQFDQQQAQLREQHIRQFRSLFDEGYRQMPRLANIVPLLGSYHPAPDLDARLRQAVGANGYILDLEWDIRSVHWLPAAGQLTLLWPPEAPPLPITVTEQLHAAPEHTTTLVSCDEDCRQYLAAPLLWESHFAGSLLLSRSLADMLLDFQALTGVDVAVVNTQIAANGSAPADWMQRRFPAFTHRAQLQSILVRTGLAQQPLAPGDAPHWVTVGEQTFELSRLAILATGVDALAITEVTAQRQAIAQATRNSFLIGLLGLALSETLLLLLLRKPLSRLRRLAELLPLLAENRHVELRTRLPLLGRSPLHRDEMDLLVDTVGNLTTRMQQLQQDREEAESRLLWLADHDPLTTLANRRRFNDDFSRVIDQALRYGHSGALLFFDLDQFKDVNDLSGHSIGDQLLIQIASQLQQIVRKSDLLARFGGDEFALAIPECNVEQAIATAERMQAAVRAIVLHSHGRRHQVSASIGIALFPLHGEQPQQVLANADLAMYQAKAKGRGVWHLFSDDEQAREQAASRVLWKQKIADALAENRFELHVQPILHIPTQRVTRMEVLLRMRETDGTLVYPDRFIPIAEHTGQIRAIDHWVLTQAIALMHEQPELCLSVNLSAGALEDPSLLPDIEAQLRDQNVVAARVTFEITETVAINSLQDAIRLMHSIRQLGCRFALDDFGSGFASYAYLRQLPIDDVKIDGAFIRELAANRADQIFVKSITDIAHSMGKRVVAEFVENEEILRLLGEIGVDYAQGYHIGRPAPLPALRFTVP